MKQSIFIAFEALAQSFTITVNSDNSLLGFDTMQVRKLILTFF